MTLNIYLKGAIEPQLLDSNLLDMTVQHGEKKVSIDTTSEPGTMILQLNNVVMSDPLLRFFKQFGYVQSDGSWCMDIDKVDEFAFVRQWCNMFTQEHVEKCYQRKDVTPSN